MRGAIMIHENDEIREVISMATNGSDVAFTRLLFLHYDRLRGFVEPRIPAQLRRHIDPEDVLQETFTSAWRKVSDAQFSDEATFVAWLRTIANRKLLDQIRSQNRKKRRNPVAKQTGDWIEAILELVAGNDPSPSSLFSRKEAENTLRQAMNTLSVRHKQVLELRFIVGLPLASVAQQMNCSSAAVGMLTQRAIKKLRQSMGNESRFFVTK